MLINCECLHEKVCEHRGVIEMAWQRVGLAGDFPLWKSISASIVGCCPYRTPKDNVEQNDSGEAPTDNTAQVAIALFAELEAAYLDGRSRREYVDLVADVLGRWRSATGNRA